MRVRVMAAAVAASLVVAAAPALAVGAAGPGGPVIVSPVDDDVVADGWIGPIEVDFTDAPPAEYVVSVDCPPVTLDGTYHRSYYWSTRFAYDGTATTVQFTPAPVDLTASRRCSVAAFVEGEPVAIQERSWLYVVADSGRPVLDTGQFSGKASIGGRVPLHVNLTAVPRGAYTVRITSLDVDRPYLWEQTIPSTWSSWEGSWTVPDRPGRYRVEVFDQTTGGYRDSLGMIVSPFKLTGAAMSRGTFYPRVRDGWRDTVTVSYRINSRAEVGIVVQDAAGNNLWGTWEKQPIGRNSLSWDGHQFRQGGESVVPAGHYTLRLIADDHHGGGGSFSLPVEVATGHATIPRTKTKPGRQTGLERHGDCVPNRDLVAIRLICNGGKITARYLFRIPGNAHHLSWQIHGHKIRRDRCCDGHIVARARRISPTQFRIRITVTKDRAYRIRTVAVSYRHHTRV